MNCLYLVLHWFIKSKDESVFNCTKLTLTEGSQAVGKVVLGCAVCRTKRYQFESGFVAPSAACFVGSGAFSCFYPGDEISCSVLDMPWAVAFPASFSRKYNCIKGKKECI